MASPLCTWIVAACVSSVSADTKQSVAAAGRRRRSVRALKCGLISAFEPCEEFYNSSRNGFLFGNGFGESRRRHQRRVAQSCSNPGNFLLFTVCLFIYLFFNGISFVCL